MILLYDRAINLDGGDYYDYLREESSLRLVDRLEDITRDFPRALEIGSYKGHVLKEISSRQGLRGKGGVGGIEHLIECDSVQYINDTENDSDRNSNSLVESSKVICESGETLPFDKHSFDVVISSMSMHWVNDLPQHLIDIREVLKPDGVFIASMLGGKTLEELKV